MIETPKTWKELVEISTKPKHKSFFGKIFDPKEFAKKVGIIEAPNHNLFIGVERHDKNGVYIPELSWCHEGHSFLWNWYKQLWSVAFALDGNDGTDWSAIDFMNFKDTSDVVTSQNYPIIWTTVNGYVIGATDATLGIRLGTDNTAVDESQNNLISALTHAVGGGATTLNYGATTGIITYDSDNKIWQADYSRLFTGNGTGTVTVAEMGLVLAVYNGKKIMTARDLVSPTVDIAISPDNATFHYIPQQEFPA